jgi:hypothetical protein
MAASTHLPRHVCCVRICPKLESHLNSSDATVQARNMKRCSAWVNPVVSVSLLLEVDAILMEYSHAIGSILLGAGHDGVEAVNVRLSIMHDGQKMHPHVGM